MVSNHYGYRFFFRGIIAVVLVLAAAGAGAQAPWKPQRPVELIVGSAAGNSNDLMLRLIAQVTQEKRLLDVPMNVMNKPGGGNTIAWSYLNQHANDGHYQSELVCRAADGNHDLQLPGLHSGEPAVR